MCPSLSAVLVKHTTELKQKQSRLYNTGEELKYKIGPNIAMLQKQSISKISAIHQFDQRRLYFPTRSYFTIYGAKLKVVEC